MFKCHIIQAEHGDCFILEYSSGAESKYVLIDGGPKKTYERHLRPELQKIKSNGGKLDLAILTHVDNDHAIGMLDLLAELREQQENNTSLTIVIDKLWHNAVFHDTETDLDIESKLKAVIAAAVGASDTLLGANIAITGFKEGHMLKLAADALGIPINTDFDEDFVCIDNINQEVVYDNLSLQLLGPNKKNLKKLKKEWYEWIEETQNLMIPGDPVIAAKLDRSTPNLSSIMVLAEADNIKVLMTGDGRADHLYDTLKQTDLLDDDGKLYVDILKLPHHGSERNVNKDFFKNVIADKYIVSANGLYGNPDLATFIWMIEAAKEQNRHIDIIATNKTVVTKQFINEYDPQHYDYSLTVMPEDHHTLVLDLA